MIYRNPVLPGFYPDPSVCRAGNDFYLVTSSFQYTPGIPIFHSKNLVNWEQIGHVLSGSQQLPLEGCRESGGVYAPTIRYHEGMFYVAATIVDGVGNFLVKAKDPAGPWSERIPVAMGGIDPTLFFDQDGKAYFLTTETPEGSPDQITMAQIDPDTGRLLSPRYCLWHGTGGKCPEGPHLYYKDGWYYLLIAEGGTETGHCVTMARARHITGPYEGCPHNPIFTHRALWRKEIQGTGHMDLIADAQGHWWAVFLGYRITENYFHHLGRETFLVPVRWPENEFPVINEGRPAELIMETDTLPAPMQEQRFDFEDSFPDKNLKPDWNFLRVREKVNLQLCGGLILHPTRDSLDTLGTPGWIGVRQRQPNACVTVRLEIPDACLAGLTVYYDHTRHFELAASPDGVFLRKRFDDFYEVTRVSEQCTGEIVFCILADQSRYHFSVGKTEEEARCHIVGSVLTRHLSTEAGPISFTGVYFALFAEGEPTDTAHFHEIRICYADRLPAALDGGNRRPDQ